jgi:hypothetical protein
VNFLFGATIWILAPISTGFIAVYYAFKRVSLVSWITSLFMVIIGIVALSSLQTYSICGLSIAEMQANPSRNCTYASNPISETFVFSLLFNSFLALSIFFVATIVHLMARKAKS